MFQKMVSKLVPHRLKHTAEKKFLQQIKNNNTIPKHIAIIMDGNGRWAKRKGLPRIYGHRAGVNTIKNVVKWSDELGVKILTFYAFSTENWRRPREEVEFLMKMPFDFLKKELASLMENNIKLHILGDKNGIPEITLAAINEAESKTKNNTGLRINFAFNYGGRAEIQRAVKNICADVMYKKVTIEDINDELIKKYLYTGDLPDPDLLIRPSGELRVSNFLLWQLAYSEFWFSNTLWPDFSRKEFLQAILDYQNRDRRFGGIKL